MPYCQSQMPHGLSVQRCRGEEKRVAVAVADLFALGCLAGQCLVGGGFGGGEHSRGAANAAGAGHPSGVVADVHGHEHGLGRRPHARLNNVGCALQHLPSGRNGNERPLPSPGAHLQALQIQKPRFVLGSHLEQGILPREGFRTWEWRARPEGVHHGEIRAMARRSATGFQPMRPMEPRQGR